MLQLTLQAISAYHFKFKDIAYNCNSFRNYKFYFSNYESL